MIDTEINNSLNEQEKSADFFRTINIQFLIHEMKGPLNVLDTNIKMILAGQEDYGRLSPMQQRMLGRSIRSTAKLRNIINSLLEVGSSQTGRVDLMHFNPFSCTIEVLLGALETLISSFSDDLAEGEDPVSYLAANNVIFSASPEIEDLVMLQDQNKYMYIIGNLTRNAMHHMNSKISIHLSIADDNLLISICDDGPGIPADDRKRIFTFYKSTSQKHLKYKGHGLGLASSRILARYLGGDIDTNPDYTEGTQFLITLPITFDIEAAKKRNYDIYQKQA